MKVTVASALLVILTWFVFWGVLSSGFLTYDDLSYLTENATVRQGLTQESVKWAFTTTAVANWHPVTWLSHMLDVQLFGLDAGKHHAVNLLLHTLNSILLLFLLFRMTGALWPSTLVAFLFAIHPLHVESVAWVAERKDVLSTLFWFLTWAAWLLFVRSRRSAWYGLAIAFFALGLMSKPMLVTLPFTLLLLDFWPLERLGGPVKISNPPFWVLLAEKIPFFALSAGSCVITFFAQRGGGAVQALAAIPFTERVANSFLSYATYLTKTVWPTHLACFYPFMRVHLMSGRVAAAILFVILATVLAVSWSKRAPYIAFGWFWYIGTLLPVIGLVQVGGQAHADRYTYVPLVGIFVAVAWGLADLSARFPRARLVLATACCLWICALSAAARVQAGWWSDSERLFRHALAVTGGSLLAHNNLGMVLSDQGRWEEAIGQFGEALRMDPNFANGHNNMGTALMAAGRAGEAVGQFEQALRLQPGDAKLLENLGLALAMEGRLPEAEARFRQSIAADRNRAGAHCDLGTVLARQNRIPEALEQFREALSIEPDLELARTNVQRIEEGLKAAPALSLLPGPTRSSEPHRP